MRQILIGLPVCYQLLVILITPNAQNVVGMNAYPFISKYATGIDFLNTWAFFAPDPGPPPIFVIWSLLDNSGKELSQGRIPQEESNPYFFADRQLRRAAVVRFISTGEGRAEKMLVPYLCRNHPEANAVRLSMVVYPVPSMADVLAGKRSVLDNKSLERKELSLSFCKETS